MIRDVWALYYLRSQAQTREGRQIDDILVSGGIAGLLGASVRLGASWLTHILGWQRVTLSHIYAMLFLPAVERGQFEPCGLVVGSLCLISGWLILGVVLSQLLAWYGFRYWYVKGPGLSLAVWPFVYLTAQLTSPGPAAVPDAVTALSSLTLTAIAGFVAAAFLAGWARWPGRSEIGPGPAAGPARYRRLRTNRREEPKRDRPGQARF